jgi:hypothetical protein
LGDDKFVRRIEPALARRLVEQGKEIDLRRFAHNLRRESDFFYFFARNPLKSPDSDEQIQGNPSNFAWFCLVLLGRSSRCG